MRQKNDFVENPIDGSPMFRNPAPFFSVVLLIIGLFLYRHYKDTTDNVYIREQNWKAGSGYNIGDWLSFDSSKNYVLRNDTIFKHNTAVAIVINVHKAVFGDNELTVKSISSQDKGTYHEK
jgi:hypothetical protein